MMLFCISILMLRIGLRLVDLNNYLLIAYMFKINRPKYPGKICWSSRRLEDVFSVKILKRFYVSEVNKIFTGDICI